MFPPESSAAQGLSHCNGCGACCRISPCLLLPADIPKLCKGLGITRKQLAAKYLQIEHTKDGRWRVRMRNPCAFLLGNECTVHAIKPTGGREYECWTPRTHALTYYWRESEVRRLGFALQD